MSVVRGTLEEVADGQWLARGSDGSVGFGLIDPGGNRHPYAPLELYLMGLLAADSVPPFRVAEDATWVRENLGHFRASRIRRVTIEDVIAEHGVRSPAPGDAPKRFRVLYAVISATPLDGATRTGIDRDVEGFARAGPGPREGWLNFWEATGGRARLVMDGLRESLRTPLAPTGGSADPPGGLSTPHPP